MSRRRAEPGAATGPPADAAAQALARARHHALRALGEALEAGRALLDAASIATTGADAAAHPLFASANAWISEAGQRLTNGGGLGDPLGPALAEALDAEIARWERRAADEEEARAVLRAFLGLRELLWEIGVRPATATSSARAAAARPARRTQAAGDARRPLERVAVVQG